MSGHDDFGGLQRDLTSTGVAFGRRRLLRIAAGLGALQLVGCGDPRADDLTGTDGGTCSRIPEETAGPYPGEGSNGPNVLTTSGVVRTDIRSSFGGLSGAADGVALTIVLDLVSASSCAALANYAVYLWHCDRPGRYSLYSTGVTNQNFLRGVQAADAAGRVTFTSIFPGCYAGRWPHIHFEVYASTADAVKAANTLATSQIALPAAICTEVYATSGYETSASNLKRTSLARDMVFGDDGAVHQLATMSGTVADNLTATLRVPV